MFIVSCLIKTLKKYDLNKQVNVKQGRPFLCKDYLSFKASCHKDISPNFLQYRKLIDKIAF